MAALREIFATFSTKVDTAPLKKGEKAVNELSASLKKMGKLAAGAFAAGALINSFKEVAQTADNLAKQAKTLGTSVEALEAWQTAAALAGVETAALNTGLRKLQLATKQAGDGSALAVRSFQQLKIPLDELQDSTPEEQFMKVGNALASIEEPAKRNAAAIELLGRSGADLIRVFDGGEEATRKLLSELQLTSPITTKQAHKLEELNDSVTRAQRSFLGFKAIIATAIVPVLLWTASKLEVLGRVLGDIAENTYLFEAALAVLSAGLVAKYVPAIAKAIAMNRGLLISQLKVLAPLALLVLVIDDLVAAWIGGESLIGDAIDSIFGEGTTSEIVEFLKYLTQGPKEALLQFLSNLQFIGGQIVDSIVETFQSIFSYLQNIGSDILDWAGEFATNLVEPILGAINQIKELISDGGNIISGFFANLPGASLFGGSPEVSSPVTNNTGGLSSNTTINVSATGGASEIANTVSSAVGGRNQELSAAYAGLVSRG